MSGNDFDFFYSDALHKVNSLSQTCSSSLDLDLPAPVENLLVLEGQSVLYPHISPNRYSLLSKSENSMLKMFFWHNNDLCFCLFAHHPHHPHHLISPTLQQVPPAQGSMVMHMRPPTTGPFPNPIQRPVMQVNKPIIIRSPPYPNPGRDPPHCTPPSAPEPLVKGPEDGMKVSHPL